jgi:hypothetical protein
MTYQKDGRLRTSALVQHPRFQKRESNVIHRDNPLERVKDFAFSNYGYIEDFLFVVTLNHGDLFLF